jgi:hypothetical protein
VVRDDPDELLQAILDHKQGPPAGLLKWT